MYVWVYVCVCVYLYVCLCVCVCVGVCVCMCMCMCVCVCVCVCVVTCLKNFPFVSSIALWNIILCEKQFLVFHGGRSFLFVFALQTLFPI